MWGDIIEKLKNKNVKSIENEEKLKAIEEMKNKISQIKTSEGGKKMINVSVLEKEVLPEIKQLVSENRLQGIFIFDTEGLPLTSYSNVDIEEDVFAASSSSIVSSAQIIASDLMDGIIDKISIETDKGIVIFSNLKNFIIAIMAGPDTKLAIIRGSLSKVKSMLESIETN